MATFDYGGLDRRTQSEDFMDDPTTTAEPGAAPGFDKLVAAGAVCSILGGICAETLSRRIRAGVFPAPDRIINARRYWFESTLRREIAGQGARPWTGR